MKHEELNSILRLHKAWLNVEEGGKRADLHHASLYHARLQDADLRYANLQGVDLDHGDLRNTILRGTKLKNASLDHADLHYADLHRADMRGANIDFASWPLWCGSLKAYVDDRIAIQLLYHTLSVVQHSPYVSEDVKKALLSAENARIANRFHRVGECGEIKEWEEEE